MTSAARVPGHDTGQFDVARVRADFPILGRHVRGKRLVYLDNAATAQKPNAVIDCIARYYHEYNANIHRGVHTLSEEATAAYESARQRIAGFINAGSHREIVFVRGTTEAINLVAQSFGRSRLQPGDEILITAMEHHSNIVPWQLLCEQTGAVLRVAPIDLQGQVDMAAYRGLLGDRTRVVAIGHVSNALGTVNPVAEMVRLARDAGAVTVVDGAQAVPHGPVDVRAIGCDFYAFSGHKLFGPTGIGVLYGRETLLDAMPPWQGGGDMIKMVSFERTLYNDLPYKFEAGTPNIAGGIGLGAAVDYVAALDMHAMVAWEDELLRYATERAGEIEGLRVIGTADHKSGILSFVLDGIHPHDLGTLLDVEGVAIRTGHHCAMPVMEFSGVPATARASLAFYNNHDDIDRLVDGIRQAGKVFGR